MAFNFAMQPQDYALRAQAGLSLDPSMGDAAVPAQAQQPTAAPPPAEMQPQPQAQAAPSALPDLKVSPAEAAMAWLMHGGTPGEAAQSVRAVKLKNMQDAYALQQSQMLMDTLRGATPQQRQAMLFNAAKYGESVAKNFEPINAAEGTTETLFGGAAQPGGSSSIAPKLMLGPGGQPIALTQNGTVSLGPQLSGKKTAANGVVTDENLGLVGSYATPQTLPPGSTPSTFTPTISGGAAPATLNGFAMPGGQGQPTAPASSTPNTAPAGRFDAANFIKSFILPHEGGLNPHDMNGSATKFGINAKANPGVDVPNLTSDQAAKIYQDKYLPMSGAADLSPALGAVHLDTAIMNPKMAHQFLVQSGGDPTKYMQLRQAWMDHMVQTNPAAAPYAKAWNQRNADLAKLIAGETGSAQSAPPSEPPATHDAAPGASGWNVGAQVGRPEILPSTDPAYARFPPGTVLQKSATGEISQMPSTGYGPDQLISLRSKLNDEEPVKNWRMADTAYGAMINSAAQPNGGMRAYALRDTFARLINPGAVARVGTIEALKQAQGVPAAVQAYFMNLKGDGDVPPAIAQQILDVAHGFLTAHYAEAKALNDNYSQFAQRHHINPDDISVPMGDEPPRMILGPAPPPKQRLPGIYATPKGPLLWQPDGWHKVGSH